MSKKSEQKPETPAAPPGLEGAPEVPVTGQDAPKPEDQQPSGASATDNDSVLGIAPSAPVTGSNPQPGPAKPQKG